MNAPICEATDAIHSQRKRGWRSGDQAEALRAVSLGAVTVATRSTLAHDERHLIDRRRAAGLWDSASVVAEIRQLSGFVVQDVAGP
jgi:hypothetical protein